VDCLGDTSKSTQGQYRGSVFTNIQSVSDPLEKRGQENENVPHIELLTKIIRITLLNEYRSFIHQIQSILLRLSPRHRPIVPTRNDINQFGGELAQPRRVIRCQHRFPDYLALLGCNGGGRRDGVCWVDEEGDKDLADSGLSRVFEMERLYLVLVNVREGDAATLDSCDASKFLQALVVTGGGRWRQSQ